MCISCSDAETKLLWFPLYRAQQQCSPASDILINYFNLLLSTTFTIQSRWRIGPAICSNCVFCTNIFIICIILHIMCLPGLLLLCPRLCRWYYSVSRLMYDRAWRDPGLGHCSDDKLVTMDRDITAYNHTSTIMMVYNYLHLHWQAAATDNNAEMSLTAVEYISMSSTQHNSSHVSTWPLYTPWPSTRTWAGEAGTTALPPLEPWVTSSLWGSTRLCMCQVMIQQGRVALWLCRLLR